MKLHARIYWTSCLLAIGAVLAHANESDANAGQGAPVPTANILAILTELGSDAGVAHPVRFMDLPPFASCGTFGSDARNALLNAAAYARSSGADRSKYAQATANVLNGWATGNKGFSGPNGWLSVAWNLGSMARSAYILKTLKAPEYEAVRSNFEKWAVYTTQAYLLPIDERHPLPDTKPELANNWELKHVSNRTMVGLEATIHVARLVGNRRWYRSAVDTYQRLICWKDFRAPRDEPGCGTTFFVNGQGENNDHYRGDPWHRTAGLASCLQICEIVKSDTGEDMFHREGDILKKSLEYYANILDPERGVPIPTWDLAARTFPDSQAIQSVALRQKAHETPSSIGTIIQYSWGLSDLLNIQGGKTQYKPRLPQRASRVSR